ncbi:hypothetical protein PTKIN_Ptkin03bG0196200 [Pterospermum kingtungense]
MRVEIDITKPLRRTVKLAGGEGRKDAWGRIAYERLPTFCYCFGLLGHIDTDCAAKIEGTDDNQETHQYGDWLRASPLKKGLTFNKKLSSSARTEEFLAQMKTKTDGMSRMGNCPPARGGCLARCLTLEDNDSLDSTPKRQEQGREKDEISSVDFGKRNEADPATLYQSVEDHKAKGKAEISLHKTGNYVISKKLHTGVCHVELQAKQEEASQAAVSTKKVFATTMDNTTRDVETKAQITKFQAGQVDTTEGPYAQVSPTNKGNEIMRSSLVQGNGENTQETKKMLRSKKKQSVGSEKQMKMEQQTWTSTRLPKRPGKQQGKMRPPTQFKRRRLTLSPVDTNDLLSLELPWAWEPTCS